MKKNWVYYMQEGLKSMWNPIRKKKKVPEYPTNLWGDDDWADPDVEYPIPPIIPPIKDKDVK